MSTRDIYLWSAFEAEIRLAAECRYRFCDFASISGKKRVTIPLGIEAHGEDFKKLVVNKPTVGEHDVKFELKYCGICHTDVHYTLNELSNVTGLGFTDLIVY